MIAHVKGVVFQLSKVNIPNAPARFVKLITIFFQNVTINPVSQENCPLGCPCDNYVCDLPEKKAVLVLYSGTESKPSVLIQPNGEFFL